VQLRLAGSEDASLLALDFVLEADPEQPLDRRWQSDQTKPRRTA
jgi:hypothetical protein